MLQLTLQVSRMIVSGRDAVHQVVDKVSQLSAALRHASQTNCIMHFGMIFAVIARPKP